MWPFTRSTVAPVTMPKVEPVVALPAVEQRSSMSGYTAALMSARESYISGRSGIAELTATAESCISLWESGFAIAKVDGTRFLTRSTMGMIARSLALRGEAVFLVRGDGLIPCSNWDIRTRDGRPTAYRLSISEAGGGTQTTALAAEVLHVRIGTDAGAPWAGQAPLRRASLTAGWLQAIETSLAEVFELAPLGSSIVPMPEQPETDSTALARSFRGQRGRILLRESTVVSAAGGPAPATDWKPASLSPDIEGAMPAQMLAAARDSVCGVFGVLPGLFNSATTGPMVRECQRHLCQWTLQPLCELLSEECTEKLGATVEIDCMTPTQSFDQGASARSVATLVGAMVQAKEAGLDPAVVSAMFAKMDWQE
jgi:hypothetical protein